jgi:hypothetical protein
MGEKQATIEGKTYKLARPFFVIATQNPVEQFGTFPLPESQLDRFTMKISVGYASRVSEKEILKFGSKREELYSIQPMMTKDEVIAIQDEIKEKVYLSDKVLDYVLDIVEATRDNNSYSQGSHPRCAGDNSNGKDEGLFQRQGLCDTGRHKGTLRVHYSAQSHFQGRVRTCRQEGGCKIGHRKNTGLGVIKNTKAGWIYILLTIFFGFSAVNTGNNLVYLIVSVLLSFMGISGFFGRRNLMNLRVGISAPDEIYAGTAIPVKFVLTNRKRFMPSFLIKVKLGGTETLLPVVAKEGKAAGLATMAFQSRGRHRIDDVYISSVFPFNFFIRFRRIDQDLDVIVFPAVKKCSIGGLIGRGERSKGDRTLDKTGFEAEMLSIRNYKYGDPQKYIHWKASARTGELKTKEFSSLAHSPLLLGACRTLAVS